MVLFALRRLVLAIPLLMGITFISFLVIQLAPGGPFDYLRSEETGQDPKLIQRLNEEFGLDKPLPVQYVRWLSRIARLDFGRSFQPDNRPVLHKIGERLPITLFLNILQLLIIFFLAIPIGVNLDWLPISGLRSLNYEYFTFWRQQWDFVSHLILPVAVAAFGGLAGLSRYMRQSMLEVIRQDYVQTARAKGLAE